MEREQLKLFIGRVKQGENHHSVIGLLSIVADGGHVEAVHGAREPVPQREPVRGPGDVRALGERRPAGARRPVQQVRVRAAARPRAGRLRHLPARRGTVRCSVRRVD